MRPGSAVGSVSLLRLAGWIAIAGLSLLALRAAAHLGQFAQNTSRTETFGFSGYYTAARLVLSGEASGNLQDWDWFREQCRRHGFQATDVFFGNPPSAAFLMLPVAALPPAPARIAWTWLILVFWFAGVLLLAVESFRAVTTGAKAACYLAVLSFAVWYGPLQSNLVFAQVYAFVFLLQSLSCVFWLRRRAAAAGALCGATLALKGYGLPFLALALLRRDWRFAGSCFAGFGVLAGLSGLWMGFRHWGDFAATHIGDIRFSGFGTPALQTLKSFLILALDLGDGKQGPLATIDATTERGLFITSFLLQAGLLVWVSEFRAFRRRGGGSANATPPPSAAALSACVAVGLVFSPRAEDYAYALAMTALILMLPQLRRADWGSAATVLAGVLLAWPVHFQDRVVTTAADFFTDFPRLWGAVLLGTAAVLAESERRRGEPNRPPGRAGAWIASLLGIAVLVLLAGPGPQAVEPPLLAVSQTDGNKLTLIRADEGEKVVATLPVSCDGPFGLAFGPRRQWLYAACTDDSTVSVLDLRRRREVLRFPAAKYPAWAQLRPRSLELWISNEGAEKVTVYRAGGSRILGEIHTGLGPADIVFDERGRLAWVSNETSGNVSLIDAAARRKLLDIAVGEVPQGMTLSPDGRWLLVANYRSNSVSLIDTVERREVAQIPVGQGPVDVAGSPENNRWFAYVSCFNEGAVSVVDVANRTETQRIPVGNKPFGIAAHPTNRLIYVCVGDSDRVVVLEGGGRGRILRYIPLQGNPLQIAVVR